MKFLEDDQSITPTSALFYILLASKRYMTISVGELMTERLETIEAPSSAQEALLSQRLLLPIGLT